MRTRDEILVMHEEYQSGKSLREVGRLHGLTGSRIGQLFDREGLPRRTKSEIVALRQDLIPSQTIIDCYKELGSVKAVATRLRIPRARVSEVVDDLLHREFYQHRRTPRLYAKRDYLNGLKRAAEVNGEPLTMAAYRTIAQAEGLPTITSIIKFFGSWNKALRAAEVKGNPSSNAHWGFTQEDCVASVASYMAEDGSTYEGYCKWRKPQDPSGPTVRNKIGSWNEARTLALDRLGAYAV